MKNGIHILFFSLDKSVWQRNKIHSEYFVGMLMMYTNVPRVFNRRRSTSEISIHFYLSSQVFGKSWSGIRIWTHKKVHKRTVCVWIASIILVIHFRYTSLIPIANGQVLTKPFIFVLILSPTCYTKDPSKKGKKPTRIVTRNSNKNEWNERW